MCKSYSGHFEGTKGLKEYLIGVLKKDKKKLTEADIRFITTDYENRILWLENGNSKAGLKHIIANHEKDFKKAFNLNPTEISAYLKKVIHTKTPANSYYSRSKETGRLYVNRVYIIRKDMLLHISIGENGFIVTSFPTNETKYLTMKGIDKNEK